MTIKFWMFVFMVVVQIILLMSILGKAICNTVCLPVFKMLDLTGLVRLLTHCPDPCLRASLMVVSLILEKAIINIGCITVFTVVDLLTVLVRLLIHCPYPCLMAGFMVVSPEFAKATLKRL